jgi:hypothetical protein
MTHYFAPLLQNRFWGQEKPLIQIMPSGLRLEEIKKVHPVNEYASGQHPVAGLPGEAVFSE